MKNIFYFWTHPTCKADISSWLLSWIMLTSPYWGQTLGVKNDYFIEYHLHLYRISVLFVFLFPWPSLGGWGGQGSFSPLQSDHVGTHVYQPWKDISKLLPGIILPDPFFWHASRMCVQVCRMPIQFDAVSCQACRFSTL